MADKLVIVESPAKAKTISRFLGKDFKVLASMGHIRDLPKSKMGIDIEHSFEPNYLISVDKKKVVKQLKDEMAKAKSLWIATDEDREGEAIGWHLLEALKVDKSNVPVHRIVFHEITEKAIKESLDHPREIDKYVVDAQQARRVLDRLVGYELSPLLWKKIRYGLSAGRVQSVAVRLVVEREREIMAFKSEEYWEIKALLLKDGQKFEAQLQKKGAEKLAIRSEAEAREIESALNGASYVVSNIEEKKITKTPAPPFITSTLQQEASRKLNFSVKKTMMIAQQLYEGLDTGGGETGLITYMRTDSVNLSEFALSAARELIAREYGPQFTLETPRRYRGKKGAQEAHEAIRPVDINLKPADAKKFLDKDQARLYELIWKRAVACQMKEAILNRTSVDINAGGGAAGGDAVSSEYIFRATGQVIEFPGFMEVYIEGRDLGEEDQEGGGDLGEGMLPKLAVNDVPGFDRLDSSQHFTKPPARYTEASLVKKLESEGIGRPSTYAPTISTIMTRGYIVREAKALKPTDLAMVVTDMLVNNFKDIVDYKFTAEMEDKLDAVEEGKLEWVPMIKDFYEPFHKNVEEKQETLKKSDIVNEESNEVCDKCGKPMVVKLGRFGKFLSCSNYPECKNAKPLSGTVGGAGSDGGGLQTPAQEAADKSFLELQEKLKDKKCDKCGEPMLLKKGRFGPFLGCSKYPECKNILSVTVFSGVKCNKCGSGQLVERRTRKGGKVFWGCNKFPECKNATWDKPVGACEKCGGLRVEKKDGVKCVECEK